MSGPDLSVIVFAFNEEANIAPVLTELREWLSAHEPSAELVFRETREWKKEKLK